MAVNLLETVEVRCNAVALGMVRAQDGTGQFAGAMLQQPPAGLSHARRQPTRASREDKRVKRDDKKIAPWLVNYPRANQAGRPGSRSGVSGSRLAMHARLAVLSQREECQSEPLASALAVSGRWPEDRTIPFSRAQWRAR